MIEFLKTLQIKSLNTCKNDRIYYNNLRYISQKSKQTDDIIMNLDEMNTDNTTVLTGLQKDMQYLKESLDSFMSSVDKRFNDIDQSIEALDDKQDKFTQERWEISNNLDRLNSRIETLKIGLTETNTKIEETSFSSWVKRNWWRVGGFLVSLGVIIEYFYKQVVNH